MLRRLSEGSEGRRRLIDLLSRQTLVANDNQIATAFADRLELRAYGATDTIIEEGGIDNDICFLLTGEASIEIGGREVGRRLEGQHVGELAMMDPAARRSATVRALRPMVVGRLPEEAFTDIAEQHPNAWRRLATETARRLRSRGTGIRPKNKKPELFIGSCASQHALSLARAVQTAFSHDDWTTRVWTDGVFGAGKSPLESLVAQIDRLDFGLVILTADDLVLHKGDNAPSPRDNVIFELGLLMGKLGRDRCFMLKVRDGGNPLRIPTDLLGIEPLTISPGDPDTLHARIAHATNELREIIRREWSL